MNSGSSALITVSGQQYPVSRPIAGAGETLTIHQGLQRQRSAPLEFDGGCLSARLVILLTIERLTLELFSWYI